MEAMKNQSSTHLVPLRVREENEYELHPNPWISKKLPTNASLYINPDVSTVILLPKLFCTIPTTLVILVLTKPKQFIRRTTVRQTWGSYATGSNKTVRTYFLMGQSEDPKVERLLQKELLIFNDIIQEQFTDVTYSESIKSLMMLKVLNDFCLSAIEYLAVTSDNVYVNVPRLLEILPDGGRDILMGNLLNNSKPSREQSDKWFVPNETYPFQEYPEYLSGPSYVMTANVIGKLYKASIRSEVFYLDDVYITGFLPKSIRLRPIEHEMFTYVESVVEPCILNTILTFMHNMNRVNMLRMHKWAVSETYKDCRGSLYITNGRCFYVPNTGETTPPFAPAVTLEFLN